MDPRNKKGKDETSGRKASKYEDCKKGKAQIERKYRKEKIQSIKENRYKTQCYLPY